MLDRVGPRDDAARLARAGFDPGAEPSQPLFPPDGWLRRVSQEPVLLFGGARALLLEVAHPLVAAGVARHSSFRSDPFGRLQRTLDAMSAISFGDRARACEAVRAVERAHARVRGELGFAAGPFPAQTPYAGRDPELVRWVWATLADTAWRVYERFVAPLPADGLADWYRDQRRLARLLGAPAELLPEDAAGFRAWFDAMLASDVLTPTDEAREVGEAVLCLVPGAVRGLTASLLPARLREAFGLAWDARRAARVEAFAAASRASRRAAADALREGELGG
jgi:uncharacterized protein (DUF2236 family)